MKFGNTRFGVVIADEKLAEQVPLYKDSSQIYFYPQRS